MKPHERHLTQAADLVTSLDDTRAGFIALALERSRRATPYVTQGKLLRLQVSTRGSASELLSVPDIQAALLTAAGVSDKAASYFRDVDRQTAIRNLIDEHLLPASGLWVEEVVSRFLLTRGDTLGGAMRNVGGALAQQKLSRYVMATLTNKGVPYHWLHLEAGGWTSGSGNDAGIEQLVKGLTWTVGRRTRTLLFNLRVPLVKKNIDLLLLSLPGQKYTSASLNDPALFLAVGELKGGIDPAGADEHWKTATKALQRIRSAFAKLNHNPMVCIIAAAIVKDMADEIWSELDAGDLTNAANLTKDAQVAAFCSWLCGL